MTRKSTYLFITFLLAAWTALLLKETISLHFLLGLTSSEQSSIKKIREVIDLTQKFYVDEVDWEKVSVEGIEGMLHSLDPHSYYFTHEQGMVNDEDYDGRYFGIGIQYDVIEGYINVISIIPGSPSEKVGIFAGDIIAEIEGESTFGISRSEVPKRLKGPKGSTVSIGVTRPGYDEILHFEILRDEIPIFTVNTSFMVNDSTGYIWFNRFSRNSASELENAIILLEKAGMKQLVLDLRGNGGGFIDICVQIVGKFISGRKKVVYTKGRLPEFDEEYFSDDYGKSIDRNYPLVILINGSSASASEILAGSLQDYDRALIAGTKSFGKGLVQREYKLNDDSRLRLTISKYYTPSGRLIQKPYSKNMIADYLEDSQEDSVASIDSLLALKPFYTFSGREVFAGGGITPDTVIEYTSFSKSPKLTQKLLEKRLFFELATQFSLQNGYVKKNKELFFKVFKVPEQWMNKFKSAAEEYGIDMLGDDWENDVDYIQNRLKAEIARNFWSQKEYWRVILEHDNQYDAALTLFGKAKEIQNNLVNRSIQN